MQSNKLQDEEDNISRKVNINMEIGRGRERERERESGYGSDQVRVVTAEVRTTPTLIMS